MYEVTLSRSSDDPTVGALLSPKYQVRENEIDHCFAYCRVEHLHLKK